MSANFVEELIFEYYKIRGYMVVSNYWFPIQTERTRVQRGVEQTYSARSWVDMDILAIGETEIIIVQVKAIINEERVVNKILSYFDHAVNFINTGVAPDQESTILWWSQGRKVKKIVVHEYDSVPTYLDRVRAEGIEVYNFTEYFDEIVDYIRNKDGVKEESSLMRMIHFLNNNKYLVENG